MDVSGAFIGNFLCLCDTTDASKKEWSPEKLEQMRQTERTGREPENKNGENLILIRGNTARQSASQ